MQLRTTHYLTLALATVLFALLLLLGLSLSHMNEMEERSSQITNEHLAKQQLINIMRDGIRVRQISLRTAVLLPRFEDREKEIKRFYQYANPVADARNRLMETALDEKERQLIQEISLAMSVAYPLQNEMIEDALFELSIRDIDSRLKTVFDAQAKVVNLLSDLSVYQTKLKTDANAHSEHEFGQSHDFILGVGLAAFIFGILSSLFIVRFTRQQESRVDLAIQNLREMNANLEQTVEERTRDLSLARDQALALSKTKSQFVANMSHELRTPLNAIIGYSEMLKEELESLDNPGITKDLDNIYAAGRQLHTLVDQVLDLSKVESGKLEIHPGWFDIARFLDNIYRIALPTVTANNNRFSVNYADDIGRMNVDNMRLRQILLNLLNNAGKFTKDGEVTLDVIRQQRSDRDWIMFTVSDTGIGIEPSMFSTIFKEFTQADPSTTRAYGGTGLGLAICQQLCVLMGGYIAVDSQLGEGSRFTVTLPAGNTTRQPDEVTELPAV
jgi:signal transduction histidine kinase